jgi:ADP-L-glycero-D-manno-heptose 6-epimerase
MLLVTGGAGFIGSNVIAELNARGRSDILVVDDLMDGRKAMNLVGLQFADYYDWREIIDKNEPGGCNVDIDGVVHLGAISDTMFTNGKILMEQNYAFSKRMLEVAKRFEAPFVYASSASVYGDGKNGFTEEPECEKPKSPYAFSKWAFDQYVRRQLECRKVTVPVTGLRYFNVYGPGENHKGEMASFVCKCFKAIDLNETIYLFEGSEDIKRDFIYVDDAVAMSLYLFDNRISGIYNIGTGAAVSFMALATLLRENYVGVKLELIPMPTELEGAYQKFTQADLSKLRAAGYHAPVTPLATAIQQYRKEFYR